MHDKTMPAEGRSSPSGQEAHRGQPETVSKQERTSALRSSAAEQPVPGPSGVPQRQGFCGLCQVIYDNVEQHILSSRHREVVRGSRTCVPIGSLMERFLQDVIQHHPDHYNDVTPTHADLPSLNCPLVPREELSDLCCVLEDDGDTVGTREEMLSTDDNSCHFLFVEDTGDFREKGSQDTRSDVATDTLVASRTSRSSDGDKKKLGQNRKPVSKHSPIKGFLHRTSFRQVPAPVCAHSAQVPTVSQPVNLPGPLHRKAHRKTDRRRNKNDSASSSSPAPRASKSRLDPPQKLEARRPAVGPSVQPSLQGISRVQAPLSDHSETVENVIEAVIQKYCYGFSDNEHQGEKDSFHLSLGSITNPDFSDSGTSLEWDVPAQTVSEVAKPDVKDLGYLMEVHINLEDQKYKSQLDNALNLLPEEEKSSKVGSGGMREETDGEVLPALPHVPQSFVGKTWSQVMYEDDLKIEAMVREFREGRFRCYFESESHAKYRKGSNKQKSKEGPLAEDVRASGDIIPLMDHPEDDAFCDKGFQKKAGRRTWRLASRCQVVKVSHSTQTTTLSGPVVKSRILEKSAMSTTGCEVPQNLSIERTPDMKTRLCALKLPESYSKIMSPLQPKTVVYVLSSPDSGPGPLKPLTIRKVGRKRKSSESETALKYKYKKTPLKYYDPLTNRILKTPPKGMVIGKPKMLPHVRQLFRSLSPDINKEKQSVEQKEPQSSSKCRGSSMPDFCASTSGSCLESIGASELGSSVSSRRALFSRSSLSGSGRFLPRALTPAPSTESTARGLPTESVESIQNTPRRGHRRERQSPGVECLKEKSLNPAESPSPPYRPRTVSTRLTTRRGQMITELPMKPCATGQQSKPGEHRKHPPKGFLPKAKAQGAPQHREAPQRVTRKKPARTKSSVRNSSQTPGMQKKSTGTLTRSSTRHLSAPLGPQKLRKRVKR
nr:DBF4-type zinc finger-containing protein 2 isoform X1 [Paramormyrops kingsleyae]XP_023683606.1 DBF4-type zinc finger-containing protein 2 isoform X1 [Paramormyrops kingsleyae]XP_023683607.1 DBF4-type zinc finger-containing protein 2 isoform X1 [Paramormyrops kingsleyae]XP_023683608.1 DBF4-type zinc finger-containing protein 2 isoform X1 [Paramormyrops kingsleyae]XP_023683609.1 DBF4-type zinc finger-containing protein 2 isoform X1 [Paramormyrops kingsleyae]XP_023683610.1 DBF4-type zinc finge